jgi:hypothetical protein
MQESATAPAVGMTARDRHMWRRMNAAMPSERLAAMRLLIERSWALLQRLEGPKIFSTCGIYPRPEASHFA